MKMVKLKKSKTHSVQLFFKLNIIIFFLFVYIVEHRKGLGFEGKNQCNFIDTCLAPSVAMIGIIDSR